MIHDSEQDTQRHMRQSRTQYASLESRCWRRPTAAVRVSAYDLRSGLCIVSPPCCDVNVKNPKRFHISSCRRFQRLYSAPTVGGSTMTHGDSRKTCCRERRDQTAGCCCAETRSSARYTHISAGRTICRSSCNRVDRSNPSRGRHESWPGTSPIRRFSVAIVFFEPKTVQYDVFPAGEPAVAGSSACFPTLVWLGDDTAQRSRGYRLP